MFSSADTLSGPLPVDQVVSKLETATVKAKGTLDSLTSTLGAVHSEVLPSDAVPATAEGFAEALGPGSSTMAEFARELTVRGSEYTLKLLLGHGVVAEYESAMSDFPKKPDGKPVSFKGINDTAVRLAEACISTMERRSNEIAAQSQSRRARSESVSHV